MKRLLLSLVVLISFCHSLYAATIYVDVSNVSGPEDGTQARPFNTIQEGIDNAGDGDTVLVADGVYTGAGNINLSVDKNITLESFNGAAATIIDCLHIADGVSSSSASFKLDGFTIRDASGRGVEISNGAGTIQNCIISGMKVGGIGIYCTGDATDCTITRCLLTDNGTGITGSSDTSTHVTNSVIQKSIDAGINAKGKIFTITNCIISGNRQSGIEVSGRDTTTVSITNCSITGNINARGGGGLTTSLSPTNEPRGSITIKNTILWANIAPVSGNEVYSSNPVGTVTFTFCNIQGGREAFGGNLPAFTYQNNINADPLFVDPANGDYRLLPGSPCIDAGTEVDAPDTDIEGNNRPIGAFVDIGAYEGFALTTLPISATLRVTPRIEAQNVVTDLQILNAVNVENFSVDMVIPPEVETIDIRGTRIRQNITAAETLKFKIYESGDLEFTLQNGTLTGPDGSTAVPTLESGKIRVVASPNWDVNRDYRTDTFDLTLVGQNIGQTVTGNPRPNPDVNRDGTVNIFDLVRVGSHFGAVYSPIPGQNAAPLLP